MTKKYTKQLSFGYSPTDGKRIRKRFYFDTKDELNQQVEEYRHTLKISNGTGRVAFIDYAERWLEIYKSNRQPATYNMYRHYIDMAKGIHFAPIYAVTTTDVQEIVNEHKTNPRTCQLLAVTLKAIFNKALEERKIEINPCNGLELPKAKPKEKRALTDTELEAIRNTDFTEQEKLFVNLLYTYGLRPSEALALTVDDFTEDNLTVNKALGFDRHLSYIKETKTGDSRVLPMTDSVYQDYLCRINANRITDGLVFLDYYGNQMSKTASEKFKRRIINKIMRTQGFDSGLTCYIFRHNRITEFIYDGVLQGKLTTKKVAQLMGNSEKMVMEVYSHIKDEQEDVEGIYKAITL